VLILQHIEHAQMRGKARAMLKPGRRRAVVDQPKSRVNDDVCTSPFPLCR
jgi:hypothetical protein